MHESDWWSNENPRFHGRPWIGDHGCTDRWVQTRARFLNHFRHGKAREVLDRPVLVRGSLLGMKHVVFRPDVISGNVNPDTCSECKNSYI